MNNIDSIMSKYNKQQVSKIKDFL
ncbi:hypothetical protein D3H17_003068, partial [Listeria monocytogenes]